MALEKHPSGRAIDESLGGPHDGRMNEALYTTSRRSLRVFHKVKVQAQGRSQDGRKFREICETLVVNAHGALLMLQHEVNSNEILVLVNPLTQEEQECRIVFLGGERRARPTGGSGIPDAGAALLGHRF